MKHGSVYKCEDWAWRGKEVIASGDGFMEAQRELHSLLLSDGQFASSFNAKWASINIFLINLNCSGTVGKEQEIGVGQAAVGDSHNCPKSIVAWFI